MPNPLLGIPVLHPESETNPSPAKRVNPLLGIKAVPLPDRPNRILENLAVGIQDATTRLGRAPLAFGEQLTQAVIGDQGDEGAPNSALLRNLSQANAAAAQARDAGYAAPTMGDRVLDSVARSAPGMVPGMVLAPVAAAGGAGAATVNALAALPGAASTFSQTLGEDLQDPRIPAGARILRAGGQAFLEFGGELIPMGKLGLGPEAALARRLAGTGAAPSAARAAGEILAQGGQESITGGAQSVLGDITNPDGFNLADVVANAGQQSLEGGLAGLLMGGGMEAAHPAIHLARQVPGVVGAGVDATGRALAPAVLAARLAAAQPTMGGSPAQVQGEASASVSPLDLARDNTVPTGEAPDPVTGVVPVRPDGVPAIVQAAINQAQGLPPLAGLKALDGSRYGEDGQTDSGRAAAILGDLLAKLQAEEAQAAQAPPVPNPAGPTAEGFPGYAERQPVDPITALADLFARSQEPTNAPPSPVAGAPDRAPVSRPAPAAPAAVPAPVQSAAPVGAAAAPVENGNFWDQHDAEVRRRLLAAGMTEEEIDSTRAELKKREKKAAADHATIMKEVARIEAALEASGAPGINTRDTALAIALGEPIKSILDKWAQAPVHGVYGFDDAVRVGIIDPNNEAARKALSVIASEIEYQKAKPADRETLDALPAPEATNAPTTPALAPVAPGHMAGQAPAPAGIATEGSVASVADDGKGITRSGKNGTYWIGFHPEKKSSYSGQVEKAGYGAWINSPNGQATEGKRGFPSRAEAEAWANSRTDGSESAPTVKDSLTVAPISTKPISSTSALQPGQRVRWTKGRKAGEEGEILAVHPTGRLHIRMDDGREVGAKDGITPENVEATRAPAPQATIQKPAPAEPVAAGSPMAPVPRPAVSAPAAVPAEKPAAPGNADVAPPVAGAQAPAIASGQAGRLTTDGVTLSIAYPDGKVAKWGKDTPAERERAIRTLRLQPEKAAPAISKTEEMGNTNPVANDQAEQRPVADSAPTTSPGVDAKPQGEQTQPAEASAPAAMPTLGERWGAMSEQDRAERLKRAKFKPEQAQAIAGKPWSSLPKGIQKKIEAAGDPPVREEAGITIPEPARGGRYSTKELMGWGSILMDSQAYKDIQRKAREITARIETYGSGEGSGANFISGSYSGRGSPDAQVSEFRQYAAGAMTKSEWVDGKFVKVPVIPEEARNPEGLREFIQTKIIPMIERTRRSMDLLDDPKLWDPKTDPQYAVDRLKEDYSLRPALKWILDHTHHIRILDEYRHRSDGMPVLDDLVTGKVTVSEYQAMRAANEEKSVQENRRRAAEWKAKVIKFAEAFSQRIKDGKNVTHLPTLQRWLKETFGKGAHMDGSFMRDGSGNAVVTSPKGTGLAGALMDLALTYRDVQKFDPATDDPHFMYGYSRGHRARYLVRNGINPVDLLRDLNAPIPEVPRKAPADLPPALHALRDYFAKAIAEGRDLDSVMFDINHGNAKIGFGRVNGTRGIDYEVAGDHLDRAGYPNFPTLWEAMGGKPRTNEEDQGEDQAPPAPEAAKEAPAQAAPEPAPSPINLRELAQDMRDTLGENVPVQGAMGIDPQVENGALPFEYQKRVNAGLWVDAARKAGISPGELDQIVKDLERGKPLGNSKAARWVREHADMIQQEARERERALYGEPLPPSRSTDDNVPPYDGPVDPETPFRLAPDDAPAAFTGTTPGDIAQAFGPESKIISRSPGQVVVRLANGSMVEVKAVGSLRADTPGATAKGGAVVFSRDGKPVGRIMLVQGQTATGTLAHEQYHIARDMGLISDAEHRELVQASIKLFKRNPSLNGVPFRKLRALYRQQNQETGRTGKAGVDYVREEMVAVAREYWNAHPDEAPGANRTVWQRIKDFFRDVLSGLGISPANARKILDDLDAGRTWRRPASTDRLRESQPSHSLSGDQIALPVIIDRRYSGTKQERREQALRDAKVVADGGPYPSPDVGSVLVSMRSLTKALSDSALNKSGGNLDHFEAVRAVPEMLKRAVIVERHADRNNDPNIRNVIRLASEIEISGRRYPVKLTVKALANPDRDSFYTYELQEMEMPGSIWEGHEGETPTASTSRPPGTPQPAVADPDNSAQDGPTGKPGEDPIRYSLAPSGVTAQATTPLGPPLPPVGGSVPMLAPERQRPRGFFRAFMRKYLTTASNLPEDVAERAFAMNHRISAMVDQVGYVERDYQQALKAAYPKGAAPADIEAINEVLRGNTPLSSVPVEMEPVLIQMRGLVDGLSREGVRTGLFQGDLAAKVAANLGTYLHRSYAVHDDPSWAKKVPVPVLNRARSFIAAQNPTMTPEEVDGVIEEILHPNASSGLHAGSVLGSKKLGFTKQRQQIPEEIRDLMGEYKNPFVNFAKSFANMAAAVEQNKFLADIRDNGMGVYFHPEPVKRGGVSFAAQIAGDGSKALDPLNGLYTTQEIADAFREYRSSGWGRDGAHGAIWRMLATLNGITKQAKTVGNFPGGHIRNFVGNVLIAAANGHINLMHALETRRYVAAKTGLFGDNEAAREFTRRITELGIVGNGFHGGEFRQLIQDATGKTLDEFSASAAKRLAMKPINFAQGSYDLMDAFWRINGFLNERSALEKAKPGMSDEALDDEAARRTNDLYPTYERIPKIVQDLRKIPLIGTFTGFVSEMARVSKNLAKYAAEDLQTPGMRSIGAKRLVGTIIAVSVPAIIAAISRSLMNVDDKDEEALRRLALPTWSKTATIAWLPRGADGSLRYVDISWTDPFSYARDPLRSLWSGKPVEAAKEALSPYIGPSLLGQAAMEAYMGSTDGGRPIRRDGNTDTENAEATLAHLWRPFEPGTVNAIRRMYKAANGIAEDSGKTYQIDDEIMATMTGMRLGRADPHQALRFRGYDLARRWRDSTSQFNKVQNRLGVKPPEVAEAAARLESARKDFAQTGAELYQDAMRLGVDPDKAMSVLKASGVSDKARYLIRNASAGQ